MKRVLLVSYVFPPMAAGGATRLGCFAKYVPKFGWAPTILTGPSKPETAVDQEACKELPDDVETARAYCPLAGVGVRGSPAPRTGMAGFRRRAARFAMRFVCIPDRQAFWLPWALRAGRRALKRRKHDVIMATFGPGTNLLVARRLARESGLPLVVDFRDLWGDSPILLFSTRWHRRLAARMERRTVAAASKVVAVSEGMADHLARRHGRRPTDVIAIPNGFDPEDLQRVRDEREEGERPFRICYAGSVNRAYNLRAFFQAISELAKEGTISPLTLHIEFIGNFPIADAARWGAGDFVETRSYIPHRQVFDAFARADALLMIEPSGYNARYGYSSKVFDYLLTGKPILALVEGGGNSERLLRAAGVGWTAHPQDCFGIKRALLDILHQKGAPPEPVDITRSPLKEFDRKTSTERLAEVLDAAASGNQVI